MSTLPPANLVLRWSVRGQVWILLSFSQWMPSSGSV
jgi:hypothetical protein